MIEKKLILRKKSVSILSPSSAAYIMGASGAFTCDTNQQHDYSTIPCGTDALMTQEKGCPAATATYPITTTVTAVSLACFTTNPNPTGKYKASDIPGVDGCGYGGSGGAGTTDTEPKTSECVSRDCSFVN